MAKQQGKGSWVPDHCAISITSPKLPSLAIHKRKIKINCHLLEATIILHLSVKTGPKLHTYMISLNPHAAL